MVVKLLQWARVRRYNQLTNVFPAGPVVPRDFLTFIYILFFFAVTLILSVFAKENGILFLGLLPWVYFLAGNPHPLYHKNILRLTLALVVVSCFVFLAASISFAIDGYGPRDFTLAERCLTQVWVLMRYLSWFWLPSYSNFHFFHDDVALVYSLFDERFIGAVCFWGAMLYIACRFRLFRFALGWFFISHLLESTIIPLEMVFEHRNYLATIGFSFLLTYGFIWLYLRWGAKLLALVVGVLCVYWAINFYMVAQSWSSRENMAIFWSDSSPQSPRLHGMKGDLYTNLGRYEEAEQEYRKIILKAPDSVMGYLALLELQCSYDSAVFPFEDFVARSKVAKYEASVINVLGEIIDLREEGLCKKIDNGYLWAILKVLQENPNVNAGRATGNFLLLEGRLCFEAEDLNCFIQRFEAAAIELKHYSILDNLYSVYLQLYGKETAQLYIEQLKLKMKE
ncbi:MAG: hypothetical protein H7A01_09635 [Hahellaceae bacterium]|nr:hypothetical protein [Hahellaceae bacterium]